jgi:hypothetical protein
MGESPRHFAAQLRLGPVGVLLPKPRHDMFAREGEHLVGDLEALGAGLGAENRRHLVVHHFDVSRIELSGRMRHWLSAVIFTLRCRVRQLFVAMNGPRGRGHVL